MHFDMFAEVIFQLLERFFIAGNCIKDLINKSVDREI